MPDQLSKSELDAQFSEAIEADDMDGAQAALDAVENAAQAPSNESGAAAFTDEALGIGGFSSVLAELSLEQIAKLQVQVPNKADLSAMYLPGTTIIDADHRIHVSQRGDVKRAARGLALAAAGGVDLDAQTIMSNSGSVYTIEDGICYELQRVQQPDFMGNVAVLEKKVPCKGHLEYIKTGKGFAETGEQHMRCLHQWALMFALGYYVTASDKGFFTEDKPIVTVEIAQRVGDEAARALAKTVIDAWVANSGDRREVRTGFAQAINAAKQTAGLADSSQLPSRTEIGGFTLPDGTTITQAVTNLRGQQFALLVELPMNDKTIQVTTRTVKTITELASVVAPHFAVAKANRGELVALELIAR